MPLAEGPSIDGGLLAAVLAVLIVAAVVWVAAVALGCRWAPRAGRGEARAAVLWAGAAFVVLAPAVLAPLPFAVLCVAAFGVQALLYFRAKSGG